MAANSLTYKPSYTLHRKKVGSPATADTASLDSLFEVPGNNRAAINCRGWDTVKVLLALDGGSSPTADIQPLEHIKADNGFPNNTTVDEGFVAIGTAESGVIDGGTFEVTINQGLLYLQVTALANSPTDVRLYIAGAQRANTETR